VDQRVVEYWAGVFGITPADFVAKGTHVVPNAGKVVGREGAWIFRHGETYLISAPPRLVPEVQRKAGGLGADAMQSPDGIKYLFGDLPNRIVGPAYQGHIAADLFRPCSSPLVRTLVAEDQPALASLAALQEWQDSGLRRDDPNLYGYFSGGQLACVAGMIHWDQSTVNVGVITMPQHRRQGFGRAAVSAAVQAAISRGELVLYQTLAVNHGAVRLAESLGCRQYGQHVFVSLSHRA
jgi:GNAT superfamily N-acetyltransferase